MLLELGADVQRQGPFEVVRHLLHGDDAVEIGWQGAAHGLGLRSTWRAISRRTRERARCSSTRWFTSLPESASRTSSELHPSTSRSWITARWPCRRRTVAAPAGPTVSW